MAGKPEKTVTKLGPRRLRAKEFFEEERRRVTSRKKITTRRAVSQNLVARQRSIRKRQINPITLIWIAIFFVFIDYLAFQKILPNLIKWVLTVVPILLMATAFFIWGVGNNFHGLLFPSIRQWRVR
jgi:hypothetical protein